MKFSFNWLSPSPERIKFLISDIAVGSQPKLSFYALLVIATLVATIGLVANSTAVVIGAMLVSPLMTPIFGISLAMLRGNTNLFSRALLAEVVGVLLAVGVAFLFGLLPLAIDPTPEMLSRTEPNLLDLIVAVLAGFAGTFALVDENISPALPGVAVATAIVPPLANTGLCLALGAYAGAFGSFLLFIANVFSILLVALLVFASAGMARTVRLKKAGMVRSFLLPTISFLLLSLFLTHSLVGIIHDRSEAKKLRQIITTELARFPNASIDTLAHDRQGAKLNVVLTVRSSKLIDPAGVSIMQAAVIEAFHSPVSLVVRTIMAKDVAAKGSYLEAAPPDLDGEIINREISFDKRKIRVAEQVILEQITTLPGADLNSVHFGAASSGPFVLATIQAFRQLTPTEIDHIRETLRRQLNIADLEVFVQTITSSFRTNKGDFLLEWTKLVPETKEGVAMRKKAEIVIKEEVERLENLFYIKTHFRMTENRWRLLVEVSGPMAPTPKEVALIEQRVSKRLPVALELNLSYKAETVITSGEYTSYSKFTKKAYDERLEGIRHMFK